MAKKQISPKPHMPDKHHNEAEKQLRHNWVIIASLAWMGYQKWERGYLFIDELPPERMRYMTLKEDMPPDREASKTLQDWAKDIEDSVNSYDPEQEVIVALWLSDDLGKGGMSLFTL